MASHLRGPAIVLIANIGVVGVVCSGWGVKEPLNGQHDHQDACNGGHQLRVALRCRRRCEAGQVEGGCCARRAAALGSMHGNVSAECSAEI